MTGPRVSDYVLNGLCERGAGRWHHEGKLTRQDRLALDLRDARQRIAELEAALQEAAEVLASWHDPADKNRPRHEPNCGDCRGCRTDLTLARLAALHREPKP